MGKLIKSGVCGLEKGRGMRIRWKLGTQLRAMVTGRSVETCMVLYGVYKPHRVFNWKRIYVILKIGIKMRLGETQ